MKISATKFLMLFAIVSFGTQIGFAQSNNGNRYISSAARPQGSYELKIFNNLYSQVSERDTPSAFRSSFLTSTASFVYGISSNVNLGFDLRYRKVGNTGGVDQSPFDVLGTSNLDSRRSGITNFGPKIRIAPSNKFKNFSIQSAFWFPTGKNLAGGEGNIYIDWDNPSWLTQFFNDFPLGDKFSLFAEVDFFWEDLGKKDESLRRASIPVTGIFSYFPIRNLSFYALAQYSPFLNTNDKYFYQLGSGVKYQVSPNFELETSYTYFNNKFLSNANGSARTINLGIRISS